MAEVLKPTPENIQRAAEALKAGQVVGMPTETVYGLAGGLFDESALARIFSVKERPTFDPLIAHVAWTNRPTDFVGALADIGLIDPSLLSTLARSRASTLLQSFWPGPFTLVLPKSPGVPDLATSALPSVAIRMPLHPVARDLILAAGTPLAAPSANRFGRISPTEAGHVEQELGTRIELILDGGPCEVGVESTVLAIHADGKMEILRPGGTALSQIETAAGCAVILRDPHSSYPSPQIPGASPGMLESHYAPRKGLFLWPRALPRGPRALSVEDALQYPGFLAFRGSPREATERFTARYGIAPRELRILSEKGSTLEAARNLFKMLRQLDDSAADFLIAEECDSDIDGLSHAIRDRLKRASTRR